MHLNRIVILAFCALLAGTGLGVAGHRLGGGGTSRFGAAPTIAHLKFGPAIRYLGNYPPDYTLGDTYIPTWADDGKTYITCNDCSVDSDWNATEQNIIFNTLSNSKAALIANGGPVIRMVPGPAFASWGNRKQSSTDGMSWKSGGLICINAQALGLATAGMYLNVRRIHNTAWYFQNGQITKSHDHGATWIPAPSAPNQPLPSMMFTGGIMPGGYFQYGQCYTGTGYSLPDNAEHYVYVSMTNGGIAYPAFLTQEWLARIPVGLIDRQLASDFEYWKGGDGMNDASWTKTLGEATPIIDAVNFPGQPLAVALCCGEGFQYLPYYGQYIHFGNGHFGDLSSNVTAFAAPHPWGPWRIVGQYASTPGEGWVNVLPESVTENGGRTFTTVASGHPNQNYGPGHPDSWYTMYLRAVTVEEH